MKGLFVLMKSGIIIFGIVAASLFIGGCGSKGANTSPINNDLLAPMLYSPPDGVTGQDLTLVLKWTIVTDAAMYDVQISANSAFTSIEAEDSTALGDSTIIGSLSQNMTYYWRVRAKNSRGVSEWTNYRSFSTTVNAPALKTPNDGAINQLITPTLSWAPVTGLPVTYHLQLSTSNSFGSTVADDSTITDSSKAVGPLSNGSTYYWRVNAKSAVGVSNWSGILSFVVVPGAPATPVLVLPANGDTGISMTPALRWNKVNWAVTYRVQVSMVPSFSSIITDDSTVADSSKALAGLSQNTMYYWRVRAGNGGGVSGWSGAWSFTTLMPAVLRQISGGTFQMGSTIPNLGASPVHSVTVSSFYMDSTLVTQASYQALLGVNPSSFDTGVSAPRRPVESVNWYDAVLYCNARSKHDGYDTVYSYSSKYAGSGYDTLAGVIIDYTKHGYRLPTEAEWEYACRGGTTTDYYWGQSYPPVTAADTAEISAHAWWYYNSPNSTQPVATKPPNGFGLYDMSGNVWQWCNDWYDSYTSGSQTNPTGAASGSYRMLRGGSWYDVDGDLCAAYRLDDGPGGRLNFIGFRCVRR